MFISFILPCYNEEQAILKVLPEAIKAKHNILKLSEIQNFEILVVNDGSTDHSFEHLQKFKDEVQILSKNTRTGYGEAIKEGIKQAQGDWVAFCDLDHSCDPQQLSFLIKLAHDRCLPVVWGNRLHKSSKMLWTRKLGNRLYQMAFLCLSFQFVPDVCSGFRLFKKSVLTPKIYEFPQNLSFSLAFTAHCIRYKIPFTTTDISYKERLGQSKLSLFQDGVIFFIHLIQFLLFKKYKSEKSIEDSL